MTKIAGSFMQAGSDTDLLERAPPSAGKLKQIPSQSRDKILDEGLDVACGYDVSSEHDHAVFFSGALEKREAADFCRKNPGYRHVCMTPALAAFNEMNLFKKIPLISVRDIYDLGDIISERFAEEASGNVTIFIGGKCKPHGTFLRIELPALLANTKVTSINNRPKSDFETLLTQNVNTKREIDGKRQPSI